MRARLLLLPAVLAFAASACGGSDGVGDGVATLESDDPDSTLEVSEQAPDEVDAEQAMLDFAACMRDKGVDIEDPTVDADGNIQFGGLRPGPGEEEGDFDGDAMREAMEACGEDLEGITLGFGGRSDIDVTEMQDTIVEYAACMRENGYDMADPDFSGAGPGSGGGGGPFGEMDPDDPDFVAAQEVCQDILGDTLTGSGVGGPPPGGEGGGGE